MTIIANNVVAKLSVALVALAMAFTLAAPASAQSVEDMSLEELIALVNQLQSQLGQGTTGGTVAASVCPYTWTRDLSTGATGADVMALQKFLNSMTETRVAASGAGSPGMETSYYGALTAAAVSNFQMKYRAEILTPLGLVNPTGYFGAGSRDKANSLCATPAPTTPGDTDDGDTDEGEDDGDDNGELQGGAGSIEDADFVTSLSNEEVGEDEEDAEVAGLEIEADGSDIELTAVSINFDQAGDDGSDNAWDDFEDYATEVSVWFDGDEVARVDADEFSDDDDFNATISLDEGAIIREGETGELIVAVSGVSNLDDGQKDDEWNLGFESLRFRDAQNAVVTDSTTGDIGDDDDDATTDADEESFSFVTFAAASDLELKVSDGDDTINDARTIPVDEDDNTDGVELMSFEVEAEGDSDMVIDDLTVDFTAVGAGVGEIINSTSLVVDGETIESESVSSSVATTSTVTFENIDFVVEAGETVEFVVEVDVNDLAGNFSAGDTLMAETDPDDWSVEDETGEDVDDNDKTGTASSDDHDFLASGLIIEEGAADSASVTDNTDTAGGEEGNFTIKFDVTAFEDTIYIPLGATTTAALDTDDGVGFTMEGENGSTVTTGTTSAAVSSTADTTGNFFVVDEGQTESFTLTVTYTPAADGFFRAQLEALNFFVGDDQPADTNQTVTPPEDYETDFVDIDV